MEPDLHNSIFFCSPSAKFAIFLSLVNKIRDFTTLDQRDSRFLIHCDKIFAIFSRDKNLSAIFSLWTKLSILKQSINEIIIFSASHRENSWFFGDRSTKLAVSLCPVYKICDFSTPDCQNFDFCVPDKWNLKISRTWSTKLAINSRNMQFFRKKQTNNLQLFCAIYKTDFFPCLIDKIRGVLEPDLQNSRFFLARSTKYVIFPRLIDEIGNFSERNWRNLEFS